MIAVRLSPELEARLEKLARETRRSKSYYVKEALAQYLSEREEALLALARLEDEGDRLLTTGDLWKDLGWDKPSKPKETTAGRKVRR